MSEPWPGLELRHLLALVAVVEETSFSRAAERLGYTQSAVSQQIAGLERIVGTPLVERPGGPRPVRPTAAGESLVAHARTVLAQVRAAEAEVTALVAGDRGRIRIGTVQSVGTKVLPEVLRRFHALRPGVVVELEESYDPALLVQRVAEGELDLTFAEEPLPPGNLASRAVLDDPFVLLAPAGSPEAARPTVPLSAVWGLPLIGYRNPTCSNLVHAFEGSPTPPRYVFQSDDNGTIQGCVGAGVGYALMPLLAIEVDDPAAIAVHLDAPAPLRRIHVVWSADRPCGPAHTDFVDVAAEVCGELQAAGDAAIARGASPRPGRKRSVA